MPEPTRDDWIRIEQEFAERWNFPNCCGSLDRKHIMITSPAKKWNTVLQFTMGTFPLI